MKYLILISLSIFTFSSCSEDGTQTTAADRPIESIDTLFDRYFEERLQLYPTEATSMGDNRYDDYLSIVISDDFRNNMKMFYQKYLDKLDQYDVTQLSESNRLSYDILKRDLQMSLEGLQHKDHLMPINQFWAIPLSFAQMGSGKSIQPFKTVKDYDNFLSRIEDFKMYTDTIIGNMRRGATEKIVLPRVLAEKMLPQYKAMVVNDVSESIFYMPVKNMPQDFSEADRERLTEAYKNAISEQVIPAYQNLYNYLNTEYLPVTRPTAGISDIPGGKELYNYMVKYWTTTDLTPDEIFNIGKQEVERIRGEMTKIKDQLGFKGDLEAFFKYTQTDPKFTPYATPEQVLARYRAIHDTMKPYLSQYFSKTPKTKFEVRRTEAFREASASAEYQSGTPDGSRPGVFYVPIPDAKKYNYLEMEALFLHEAIPGHHYQLSLQQENEDIPKFRKFSYYGAFGEGWALYSESLGKELGLYKDPYSHFGGLSKEIHRAIRLVVDVGMHMKGWTREEAIKYMLENESISEDKAIAEIERYMALPGQALSYKIGQLKIQELRDKAQRELGTKFSLAAFHDKVLEDGVLPLDVLEMKIDRWIENLKKS